MQYPQWSACHSHPHDWPIESQDRHVHLHVISADLCSSAMKNKKHYNSFHPKLGFFIHLDEVLSWFDSEPSYFSEVRIAVCLNGIRFCLSFKTVLWLGR